ncbi:phage tail protein [Salmonella enterica subsp. enterica serovar Montevideo]|nr:phage tail protein [Salmonella enterica subsp. enterica serovar Montevideo]MEA6076828.1 phage tail protein [Salmonella enterica subsp. enterica serovar Montevideo]MEA6407463.1 phage tail protein [Salmonella enterica subsp. enterica serovar Montevideo]MEA6433487.1 phage tail protein [Salmonella enterica subsp. enterica serovar Montevideo]MEA6675477.1 phage tail protein [Salmonella enterica subsp. enterica serovar Montevideo]
MSAKFYTLLTEIGAAKLASAAALGVPLKITHMAVGDGGGVLPTPSAQQTALVAEKRRAALNMLYIDPQNSSQIIAEQVIPETEGGWWIREVGLFDETGALIAVGNCPESYKPQLTEGSGRTQTVRMVLITSSTDNITLKIDPAVVLATRKYVDDKALELKVYVDDLMAKHLAAPDPHSQYAQKDSPTLTGIPKVPTPAAGNSTKQIANTEFVASSIAAMVDSAPAALDTLNELAAALGNDPNFATTMINALAGKQPLDNTLTNLSGKDIAGLLTYLGLGETAKQAAGAVQKTGDEMSGKLTLPQTSSFGVNTNNTLGGSSIAIGDNDTGLKGNGDGNLAFMANNVLAGYFNENELQHSKKMLTKNFQALVDNNWPEGAGGFSGQLSSEAPFSVPMVHRQNNDNNFFPLLKGKVSLESGYPVAASFGILTSGNTNFPQIAIHAKTDFDVNDKIWVFDVATGEFRAPGRITATEILLSGKSRVAPDGNLYGDVWGGWLNDFLNNNYNRKNTASLGDYGWVRDESTGFIMQWGTLGSSNGTYNFPREFPASCFAVFVTNNNQQGGAVDNAFGYPVSKSQFFAATKDSSSSNHINNYPVAWFAIGR